MIAPVASSTGAAAPAGTQRAELRRAAEAFEAIFVRQMLASMRAAKLTDGAFDSSATDQFVTMQDDRLADSIAANCHLGIAAMLTRQLAPAGAAR